MYISWLEARASKADQSCRHHHLYGKETETEFHTAKL